jgi:hypothetical protein
MMSKHKQGLFGLLVVYGLMVWGLIGFRVPGITSGSFIYWLLLAMPWTLALIIYNILSKKRIIKMMAALPVDNQDVPLHEKIFAYAIGYLCVIGALKWPSIPSLLAAFAIAAVDTWKIYRLVRAHQGGISSEG